MEDAYSERQKSRIMDALRTVFYLLIIVVILAGFFFGLGQISSGNTDRQEKSLQTAIERDIVQCYSLEGIYPPSLKYIEDHYGLIYDKELFFVDYRPIGSNIYPDVTIIRIKEQ